MKEDKWTIFKNNGKGDAPKPFVPNLPSMEDFIKKSLLIEGDTIHAQSTSIFRTSKVYNVIPRMPKTPTCEPFDHLDPATSLPAPPKLEYRSRSDPTKRYDMLAFEASLPPAVRAALEENRLPPQPFQQTHAAVTLYGITLARPMLMISEARRDMDGRTFSSPPDISAALQPMVGDETCSKALWGNLRRVDLPYMWLRKVHKGRYLLLRALAAPVVLKAPIIFTSDPTGHNIDLVMHHLPLHPLTIGKASSTDLAAQFPIGTIIAIKEPRLRSSGLDPGHTPEVVVNSSTDWMIVQSNHDLLEDVQWMEADGSIWVKPEREVVSFERTKKRANKLFTDRLYLQAKLAYDAAIQQFNDHPHVRVLYLNRSAANLALERYIDARRDAGFVISLLSDDDTSESTRGQLEKAMVRRARAYDGLRQWNKAHEAWRGALGAFPLSQDAQKGLEQAKKRLQEANHGDYDMVELFKTTAAKLDSRHPIADYIGPIAVRTGKLGRGIFATSLIKAGELVVATKALAAAFPEDLDRNDRIPDYNYTYMQSSQPMSTLMRHELNYRLSYNPYLAPVIDGLSGGPLTEHQSYFPLRLDEEADLPHNFSVDYHHLDRACTINGFKIGSITGERDLPSWLDGSGMFGANSLFNHSCIPSGHRYTLGDVQFIRAAFDIPPGTEITIAYAGGPLAVRLPVFQKLNFECECERCVHETRDGIDKVLARSQLLMQTPPCHISRDTVSKFKADIEQNVVKSYGPYWGSVKADQAQAYLQLGIWTMHMAGDIRSVAAYQEAAGHFERALTSLGAEIAPYHLDSKKTLLKSALEKPPVTDFSLALNSCVFLAAMYDKLKNASACIMWLETAIQIHDLAYGGGRELFKLKNHDEMVQLGFVDWLDDFMTSYERAKDEMASRD